MTDYPSPAAWLASLIARSSVLTGNTSATRLGLDGKPGPKTAVEKTRERTLLPRAPAAPSSSPPPGTFARLCDRPLLERNVERVMRLLTDWEREIDLELHGQNATKTGRPRSEER